MGAQGDHAPLLRGRSMCSYSSAMGFARNYRETVAGSSFGRRRAIVLLALSAVVGLSMVTLAYARNRHDDQGMDPRAGQREYLRWMAAKIFDYSVAYHRPVYFTDSVVAHLDSADAARFRRFSVDLWGDPVSYWWDEYGFTLTANAGVTPQMRNAIEDSVYRAEAEARKRGEPDPAAKTPWKPIGRNLTIREEFGWPPDVTQSALERTRRRTAIRAK